MEKERERKIDRKEEEFPFRKITLYEVAFNLFWHCRP